MTQNIPTANMLEHRPTARLYATVAEPRQIPAVGLDTGYVTHLESAGFPDSSEAAQNFATGQRMTARQDESRAALTTAQDVAPEDMAVAPPGTGPAQPVATVGPSPAAYAAAAASSPRPAAGTPAVPRPSIRRRIGG